MSETLPLYELDDEPIWCEIRLAEVAHLIDGYKLWKDDRCWHRVDWHRVCTALATVLQETATDGLVDDLAGSLAPLEARLSRADRVGLHALVLEPLTVTPVQLTNGGHRLTAMRKQGVTKAPGLFVRGDVGTSIRADQIYPTRSDS